MIISFSYRENPLYCGTLPHTVPPNIYAKSKKNNQDFKRLAYQHLFTSNSHFLRSYPPFACYFGLQRPAVWLLKNITPAGFCIPGM
jgi:hypothetical protein